MNFMELVILEKSVINLLLSFFQNLNILSYRLLFYIKYDIKLFLSLSQKNKIEN